MKMFLKYQFVFNHVLIINNINIFYFSMQAYEENHIGDFAYVISKDNENDDCVSIYKIGFSVV